MLVKFKSYPPLRRVFSTLTPAWGSHTAGLRSYWPSSLAGNPFNFKVTNGGFPSNTERYFEMMGRPIYLAAPDGDQPIMHNGWDILWVPHPSSVFLAVALQLYRRRVSLVPSTHPSLLTNRGGTRCGTTCASSLRSNCLR